MEACASSRESWSGGSQGIPLAFAARGNSVPAGLPTSPGVAPRKSTSGLLISRYG